MSIDVCVVLTNDAIQLCHEACKCCWGKECEITEQKMCEYIGNRVKVGHESVLEHSNIVLEVIATDESVKELQDFLYDEFNALKRLTVITSSIYSDDERSFLIGGSIRAYKEMIRYIEIPENRVYRNILTTFTGLLDKAFLLDLIQDNIISEDQTKTRNTMNIRYISTCNGRSYIDDTKDTELVNIDDYSRLVDNIIRIDGYTTKDLYQFLTVTFDFKKLSRAASHQLVRHRNGITQSSMRYIDQSSGMYILPEPIADNEEIKAIFGEIYGNLSYKYTRLRDMGVNKEDARYILPQAIASEHLYMTFTYLSLIKFLELRTDIHAQYEIRSRALSIENYMVNDKAYLPPNYREYLLPIYKIAQEEAAVLEEEVDDVISESTETLSI